MRTKSSTAISKLAVRGGYSVSVKTSSPSTRERGGGLRGVCARCAE